MLAIKIRRMAMRVWLIASLGWIVVGFAWIYVSGNWTEFSRSFEEVPSALLYERSCAQFLDTEFQGLCADAAAFNRERRQMVQQDRFFTSIGTLVTILVPPVVALILLSATLVFLEDRLHIKPPTDMERRSSKRNKTIGANRAGPLTPTDRARKIAQNKLAASIRMSQPPKPEEEDWV